MFKLSREGILFHYHGDLVTRRWPWSKRARYYSSLHDSDFNSIREYWQSMGALEASMRMLDKPGQIKGMMMYELLSEYSRNRFIGEPIAILCDINPAAAPNSFWKTMPKAQAEQLTKDIAIFRCKDRSQMLSITLGTNPSFASAYAIENGVLIDSNLWRD